MGEKRRKKSWREIDRMRDHGGNRRAWGKGTSTLEKALEDPRLKEQYLKEAEDLFKGPKGRPEHAKDLRAIHDAYGTAKFPDVVRHYVETYGMPEDWGTLMILLDLKEDRETVIKAMEGLRDLYDSKGRVEQKGLKSRLRVLSMTSDDPDIQENAETILSELG